MNDRLRSAMPDDAQSNSSNLSPGEKLALIRKRQVNNLIKKQAAGGVLTPAQRKEIEDFYAAQSEGGGSPAPGAKGAANQPSSYASMKQAAAAMHLPLWVLKAAKDAGCAAFRANRVYRGELITFLEAHPEIYRGGTGAGGAPGIHGKKEEKLTEEIRKLRIRNDADEARTVSRAFVIERFQRLAGELNGIRAKSEAEHPLKFAACGQNVDVAKCRTVLRGVWDDILIAMSRLGHHFEEPPAPGPAKAA